MAGSLRPAIAIVVSLYSNSRTTCRRGPGERLLKMIKLNDKHWQ
jgi:hypothetical protein